MRDRIPHEIVASVLAGLTAFIGGTALNLPPWAIFIGWAGTFLLGGPSWRNARRLWLTMPIGSTFALVIVLVDQHIGTIAGDSRFAQNLVLALIIFVVNTALMFSGRIAAIALIPGMFLGFASYFATFFGGFGFDAGNPWAAWVSVVAMNFLGPVFAYLSVRLAFPRRGVPDNTAAATSDIAVATSEHSSPSADTAGLASAPARANPGGSADSAEFRTHAE